MKGKTLILAIAVVAIIGIGAGAFFIVSGQPAVGKMFVANLSGMNEVPPNASAASGQAVFRLSADGSSMSFTLSVANINDATAAHIHTAMPGVNGPIVVPLFAGPKPGMFTGVLSEGVITGANLGGTLAGMPLSALIAQIEAGNTYVNVHTTLIPGGEIRGQIMLSP